MALIVAEAPCVRSGWTLLGRLVQMTPPRRLGSSLKFRLRRAMGLLTDLSSINSRSIVLRRFAVDVLADGDPDHLTRRCFDCHNCSPGAKDGGV